jgi:NAD+ synthase (glutamine-hydrolysing)
LEKFAKEVPEGLAVAIGFVDFNGDLYNACAVVSGGEILHRYHKRYLPNYGVFDENRYFLEGSGAPILKVGRAFVGLSICEDIWYPGGPPREQALNGAGILLNVSASPYHRLKGGSREKMLGVRASDYGCYVVFCNLVGGQDELVFDGRSAVFDPEGNVIARARQFEEDLLFVDLYPEEALIHRLKEPRLRKETPGDQRAEIIEIPGSDPVTSGASASSPEAEHRVESPLSEEGEVLEALVLGLKDYFRKNGFSRAVLGLSGGIDSAFGAAVAARALGSENVIGVLMPSRYTSEESNTDAEALVKNLGIDRREIAIEPAFEAYKEMLAEPFDGLPEDETEENIQSRIRGNILMALSNKFGWIVLSTGNKSESSVGYSTLYGDTAGGFSVIQDVPKTLVYRVCRHINEVEGREVIPDSILTKEPSAELKEDQRDTDSLPPYETLDPILEAYVEEDKGIGEIVAAGFDEEDVRQAVKLVEASEYKRRQAPTGIKVTARSFGRDRRMPITNRYSERLDDGHSE